MNKQEAREVIEDSLSRGSGTPVTWTKDRDAYIAKASSGLLSSLIDPVPVRIVDETYKYDVKMQMEASEIFAIARRDDDWLLYSPARRIFSRAFGPNEDRLSILGFASPDALAEWLG